LHAPSISTPRRQRQVREIQARRQAHKQIPLRLCVKPVLAPFGHFKKLLAKIPETIIVTVSVWITSPFKTWKIFK
jgi:hypothetical protein